MTIITSDNFVNNVLRTDTPTTPELIARLSDPKVAQLIRASFDHLTDAGAMADMIKKHVYYGRPLSPSNVTDEPVTPELIARLSDPNTVRLFHAVIGLVTEGSELVEMLFDHIFQGQPLDLTNAMEEGGDACWYIGLLCDVLGITFDDMLNMVICKLSLRYPEKFTEHYAINRDVNAERALLEGGYEGVTVKEYCAMNNLNHHEDTATKSSEGTQIISQRGLDWLAFSSKVLDHIENYTVPQYGDKGDDQATNYSDRTCVTQVEKYAHRFGKNVREGQQIKDFLKIAHYTQMGHDKYADATTAKELPVCKHGHVYGVDADLFEDCEGCPHPLWSECFQMSTKAKQQQSPFKQGE